MKKPNELMFKDILIYFLLAFFICFLSVFIISFVSFQKLYQQSIEEVSNSIASALKAEENRYRNIAVSFGEWNQSYQNIYQHYNSKWIEENIVYDLEKSHNIPFFAIINRGNNTVVYSTDNKILEQGKTTPAALHSLLKNSASADERGKAGFVSLKDSIFLFSVATISQIEYAKSQGTVTSTNFLVLIGSTVNEAFVAKFISQYNLVNVKFNVFDQVSNLEEQPSYPLLQDNKVLGAFTWSSYNKMKSLLITLVPTCFIVIFLMSLMGLFIARKLSQVSYKYEQMVWDLSELANNLEKEKTETTQNIEAKNRFLSMMSHQIRTPMTGLVGMINLLKETELTDAQVKYVNTMDLSTSSLLRLVDSTLEYSRLESGEVSLSFANINLRQLVDEIHGLLLPVALQRKLKFEIFFSRNVPSLIRSDAICLRQIILHFVTNALKFTKVGSVKINVTAIELSESRTEICLQVIDTGIGIAEGLRQSLFEEFFKVDNGMEQSSEGMGLGLTIVRTLTHLLQGKVGIESKLGQGSTFWVEFPAEVIKAYDKENLSQTIANEKQNFLLIVPDHKTEEQGALPTLLQSLGHEVKVAKSAQQAVDTYQQQSFTAVFVDLSLTNNQTYSLSVTEKIRLLFNDDSLPLIAIINAGEERKDHDEIYDYLLTAPFTGRKLRDLIKKVLLEKQ